GLAPEAIKDSGRGHREARAGAQGLTPRAQEGARRGAKESGARATTESCALSFQIGKPSAHDSPVTQREPTGGPGSRPSPTRGRGKSPPTTAGPPSGPTKGRRVTPRELRERGRRPRRGVGSDH